MIPSFSTHANFSPPWRDFIRHYVPFPISNHRIDYLGRRGCVCGAQMKLPPFCRRHFKCHFLLWILLHFLFKFYRKLFPSAQLTIIQHWFRQWFGAEQGTSHYLNQWWHWWMMHICVTRPQWDTFPILLCYYSRNILRYWYFMRGIHR